MKLSTVKTAFLSTVLASFLMVASLHGAYAQSPSISGDDLCGSSTTTVCGPSHLAQLGKSVMLLVGTLGATLVVIFILIRFGKGVWAKFTGDAAGIAKARNESGGALIGFIMVLAAGSILLVGLKILGAQPWATQFLKLFLSTVVDSAYAQEKLLPNPLGSNSLYDIIISAANLAMRFFIYPSIIAAWVASGFKLVYSQGNPEGLKTAKNWLLISFIYTVVAFSLQGFILAFRGTAEKILPSSSQQSPTNTSTNTSPAASPPVGTADGRGVPTTYTPADPNAPTSCAGLKVNTECQVAGRKGSCTSNEEGNFSCYVDTHSPGSACTLATGKYGRYGTDGVCY